MGGSVQRSIDGARSDYKRRRMGISRSIRKNYFKNMAEAKLCQDQSFLELPRHEQRRVFNEEVKALKKAERARTE